MGVGVGADPDGDAGWAICRSRSGGIRKESPKALRALLEVLPRWAVKFWLRLKIAGSARSRAAHIVFLLKSGVVF